MKPPAALLAALAAAPALGGCFVDDMFSPPPPPPAPPAPKVLTGDLDTDIRQSAHVVLRVTDTDVVASLTLTKGFGVAPEAVAFSGSGQEEAFPEADMTLYTARIDAPADPSGPCGAQPVSLALSLHRRGKAPHVGGSLTAYCGAGMWHGVPGRILRLSGDLPLP